MSTAIVLLQDSELWWVDQVRTVESVPATFLLVMTHLGRDSTVLQCRVNLLEMGPHSTKYK